MTLILLIINDVKFCIYNNLRSYVLKKFNHYIEDKL